MKKHTITLSLILSLSMGGILAADTIRMKDGTSLECDILSEDAEFYTVSVNVTKTIKDERKIAKADVASIDKVSPADEAYELIATLLPTGDNQSVDDYDRMINRQVNRFLEAFPDSSRTKDAEGIRERLEKERSLVEQGGLKLDGKWISPADRLANAYELDARIALDKAEEAAEAGDLVTALRTLDVIHADFTGAENYAKAVELSKKVLKAHKAKATLDFKRVDELLENRKVELTRLKVNQRELALQEIKKEDARYLAAVEQDKKAGLKWPHISIYHKGPLTDTIRAADSEIRRVDGLDLSAIKPVGQTYRDAWAAAVAGKEEEAKGLFTELRSLKVPDRYITQLEAQLPEPESENTPPPSTGDPEDEPEGGEGEKPNMDEEKSAEEQPSPDDVEPAGNSETSTSDATDEESTGSANEPAAADDEGSSMTTILIGVMAVVVLIAIGAVFAGGKKKK